MPKKTCIALAVIASPMHLAVGMLAAQKIAYLLLALNLVGVPVSLVLVGSFFIAGGVLFLLRDPVTGLILN